MAAGKSTIVSEGSSSGDSRLSLFRGLGRKSSMGLSNESGKSSDSSTDTSLISGTSCDVASV